MDVLATANRHEVMVCCVVDQELLKKLPAIYVPISKPKSLRLPKRPSTRKKSKLWKGHTTLECCSLT
jgi:hypothetical protein